MNDRLELTEILERAKNGTLHEIGLAVRGLQIGKEMEDKSFLAFSRQQSRIVEVQSEHNPNPYIESREEYKFRLNRLKAIQKVRNKGEVIWNSSIFGTRQETHQHDKLKAIYDKLIESDKLQEFLETQDKSLFAEQAEQLKKEKYGQVPN